MTDDRAASPKPRTFSIVVPIYQNHANVQHTVPKLLSLREKLPAYRLELVFVDDGSTDDSWDQLKVFREKHPDAITLVRLSRNFGQTPATQAGLRHASGDCVGIISADLQEPWETFADMVGHWEKGARFVIGERVDREEGQAHRSVSSSYWWIVRRFALKDFPPLGYDFCLLDRVVVDAVGRIDEKNTSIFPLIYWLGFRPVRVPIVRQLRQHGTSQWSFARKVRITVDTLIAFTHVPTRVITFSGITASFLSIAYFLAIMLRWIFFGTTVPGWHSIICLILIVASLTLFSLGIISEYLWRILDEARGRPPFVVEEVQKAR